jgi:phasin family protein
VEAVVKASGIFSKGLQDLGKAFVALTQTTIEENVAASKALFGAKSLQELIDIQTTIAKSSVDKAVKEATLLSEQSVKLVEQTLAPINERVNVTMDKLVKSAA